MIKTIIVAKKFCHALSIFKALNILKIDDIYRLESIKFMYQTFNENISHKIDRTSFNSLLYINITLDIFPTNSTYRVNTCYGHKMLSFAGFKFWFELDPDVVLAGSSSKNAIKKILEKYDENLHFILSKIS